MHVTGRVLIDIKILKDIVPQHFLLSPLLAEK